MLNIRFIRWPLLFVLLLVTVFSGCRTAPPPVPQKTHKTNSGVPAAASQSAAEKAFDELEHPSKPVDRQPVPSPQPATEKKTSTPSVDSPTPIEVSGKKPGWVDGSSKRYPATHYLTGVASGSDRVQAEDGARAEIAKVFVSHVNASTKVQQEYLQVVTDGKDASTNRVNVQDMVQVSTRKVLSGIRIAEVYHQSRPGELFYALAVLDRRQALTTLREKVHALDQEIAVLMAQALEEVKDLRKLKTLTSAMEKHLLRQAHEAELTVVDPSGKGMAAPIGFEDIKRPMTDILSRDFRIHMMVSGDRAAEIQKALSEGLTREGFVLANTAKQAQVVVRGDVKIRPLNRPDEKWKYVRWQTAFELVDLSDQSVFGTLSRSGREGHLSLEQAEDRAVLKIQKELLPNVSKDVHNYIFGQAPSH